MRPGDAISVAGLDITAVAAQHRVGLLGHGRALGYVVRGDGPTVYFAARAATSPGSWRSARATGPTSPCCQSAAIARRRSAHDHLSPLDALYAFEDLGAQLFVPIHHGAFALGYEPPSEPLIRLRSLASQRRLEERIAWLEPGESCVARRSPLQTWTSSDM